MGLGGHLSPNLQQIIHNVTSVEFRLPTPFGRFLCRIGRCDKYANSFYVQKDGN